MKFLQIKQNGNTLETPRLLELGVDFNHIRKAENCPIFLCTDSKKHNGFDWVCNLSDCYQSKPLIELMVL